MLFNTPQYVEVEDKVAGPLTAKQLLWMFGMAAVLLAMWGFLDKTTFFISAIPVAGIFCALAFYKPHGQPLIKFIIWGILFAFKPKMYVWQRIFTPKRKEEKIQIANAGEERKRKERQKEILLNNVASLAKTLDTEGMEKNEKLMEIIRRNREKNKNN